MEFPPLATLANSFIAAFNNLGYCAPLSVKSVIVTGTTSFLFFASQSVSRTSSSSSAFHFTAVETTLLAIAQRLHKVKLLSYNTPSGSSSSSSSSSSSLSSSTELVDGTDRDPLVLLAKGMVDHLLPLVSKLLQDVYQQKQSKSHQFFSSLSIIVVISSRFFFIFF